MQVVERYAMVKPGEDYRVVNEGYDYVTLKCNGKNICVPNAFVFMPRLSRKYDDLPTYEDIIEDEND